MPRYNVNHNGKWACFSSVVDGFLTVFTDKEDYESWRKCEYGTCRTPAEQCNSMIMSKAVSLIRLNQTHEESIEHLIDCGLSPEEAEKLIYDTETEHWCPKLKENGKHECPNCGSEVEPGQVICKEDTCELEFVWRK